MRPHREAHTPTSTGRTAAALAPRHPAPRPPVGDADARGVRGELGALWGQALPGSSAPAPACSFSPSAVVDLSGESSSVPGTLKTRSDLHNVPRQKPPAATANKPRPPRCRQGCTPGLAGAVRLDRPWRGEVCPCSPPRSVLLLRPQALHKGPKGPAPSRDTGRELRTAGATDGHGSPRQPGGLPRLVHTRATEPSTVYTLLLGVCLLYAANYILLTELC